MTSLALGSPSRTAGRFPVLLALILVLLNPRVMWGQTSVVYVNTAAAGTQDGSSWDDAFESLQDALSGAEDGDEIWVASGTYFADSGEFVTRGDRDASFVVPHGVAMYGGFSGSETSRGDRASSSASVLDGDIGLPGFTGDNTRHVVTFDGRVDSQTIVDGFTITRGLSVGSTLGDVGAGLLVLNSQGTVVLNNLVVQSNRSSGGSGLYTGCSASATCLVSNSTFLENIGGEGSGIMFTGPGNNIARNVELRNHSSEALHVLNGSAKIVSSTFADNGPSPATLSVGVRASVEMDGLLLDGNLSNGGAAISVHHGGVGMLQNSVIRNTAGGSGIDVNSGLLTIRNSTIALNHTSSALAGGIRAGTNGQVVIWNSIIAGNTSGGRAADVSAASPELQTIGSSFLATQHDFFDLGGNIVSPTRCWTDSDDLLPMPGGLCVDAGDNNQIGIDLADRDQDGDATESSAVDLSGNPRIVDNGLGRVDMGAYEVAALALIAAPDQVGVVEDSSIDIQVLSNDWLGGASVTDLSVSQQPVHGEATVNLDQGTVRYAPDRDFFGPDSLVYVVVLETGESDSARVSVSVSAVNDAPLANPDSVFVTEGRESFITTYANDVDVDDDELSFGLVANSSAFGGTLGSGATPGVFSYSPAAGFTGEDRFHYWAGDPNGLRDTTWVVVTVRRLPEVSSVLRVPGEYGSIEEALDAAAEGDTVLVAPGTYTENIVWPNRNGIALIASGDSSDTVLDGSSLGTTLRIALNSTVLSRYATLVRGLTITGGLGETGGVSVSTGPQNTVVLEQVAISGNRGAWNGGGIAFSGTGYHILRQCSVSDNQTVRFGGGIFNGRGRDSRGTRLLLENCLVYGNHTDTDGGGVFTGGFFRAVNSTIVDNAAPGRYGPDLAIEARQDSLLLMNTIVKSVHRFDGHVVSVHSTYTSSSFEPRNVAPLAFSQDIFDPVLRGYSLSPSSSAVGRGVRGIWFDGEYVQAPSSDFFGQARPFPLDTAPDLGAIESGYGGEPDPDVLRFFSLTLNISDSDAGVSLGFGLRPDATPEFDAGIDQFAPPEPPSGVFDARFTGPVDLLRDYRSTTRADVTWPLRISSLSASVALSWDPQDLPSEGSLLLQDGRGQAIEDMSSLGGTSLPPGIYLIRFSPLVERQLTLERGWNLLGIPLGAARTAYELFPAAMPGSVFGFSGAYSIPEGNRLARGRGYWIRTSEVVQTTIEGQNSSSVDLTLEEGWNLIAGPNCELPESTLRTSGVVLAGTLFSFRAGYRLAQTIEPGLGYWIRATSPISLPLDCSQSGKGESASDALSDFNMVTLVDAHGVAQTLYVGGQLPAHAPPSAYSIPPPAPGTGFSVATDEGRYVAEGPEASVVVSGGAYPITISVDRPLWIDKGDDKPAVEVLPGESFVLVEHVLRLRVSLHPPEELPRAWVLEQNYPNPFNPVTTIRFGLPADTEVSLEVFDLLGRRVAAILAGETRTAGWHEVAFDASRLATGTYFYRLRTNGSVQMRQLVVLR